jgi:hypothetical protein
MNFVTAALSAVSSFFGWLTGRSTLNNAADVKAAQKAQDEANAKGKTADAIAKKDTNEIRNEIAD